jgi:hypothetical protein
VLYKLSVGDAPINKAQLPKFISISENVEGKALVCEKAK